MEDTDIVAALNEWRHRDIGQKKKKSGIFSCTRFVDPDISDEVVIGYFSSRAKAEAAREWYIQDAKEHGDDWAGTRSRPIEQAIWIREMDVAQGFHFDRSAVKRTGSIVLMHVGGGPSFLSSDDAVCVFSDLKQAVATIKTKNVQETKRSQAENDFKYLHYLREYALDKVLPRTFFKIYDDGERHEFDCKIYPL